MKRDRRQWLVLAVQYVQYCFRAATVPRVDEMARMLGMSREGLTRAFHDATGFTPAHAFRALQLKRAKDLLIGSDQSTAQIARAAAFGSTRVFYRVFQRCVGMTPTEYRRRNEPEKIGELR